MNQSTEPKHTPTRCKDCKWIHEADSVKKTSYMGVEFCAEHNRAVNSHDELLSIAQSIVSQIGEAVDNDDEITGSDAVDLLANVLLPRARMAITKAEGKS